MIKSLAVFICISFVLCVFQVRAQIYKNESVITVGMGLSSWNIQMGQEEGSENASASSTPTFNLFYDYAIVDNFSFGVALSYNSLSYTDEDYTYWTTDTPWTYIKEPASHNASRINIGIRPLLHFGKREDLDWHVGFRFGYSIWEETIETSNPNYNRQYVKEGPYSFQVLFGVRAFFTEKMALTFDVGATEPYYASMGFSIKL